MAAAEDRNRSRDATLRVSVLLVEDNPADARMVVALLKQATDGAFEVTVVQTLAAAREVVQRHRTDLVLLDLDLPDSTGLATLTGLRDAAPHVPLVILTGYDDTSTALRAVEHGAQEYLVKGQMDGGALARTLLAARRRQDLQRVRDAALTSARDRARLFRDLVDGMGDAVVVVDEQSRVLLANPAAEALYGRSQPELMGVSIADVVPDEGVLEIVRRDGSRRMAEARAVDASWHGRFARIVSLRDITEAHAARERDRRLVHFERLAVIGQMAAGIAHEINNPATFVLGTLSALHDRFEVLLAKGGEQNVGTIIADVLPSLRDGIGAVERIGEITRGLRQFARPEEPRVRWVDLEAAVARACRMVETQAKHRVLIERYTERVPPIAGYPTRIEQVIVNLLMNAVEATTGDNQRGAVRIELRPEGSRIELTVIDDGPGVPAEIRHRIFDTFFSTKAPEAGTGLGLPISREIVALHGGEMHHEDVTGGGACFRVLFPIDTGLVPEDVDDPVPRTQTPGCRPRVLVIDDEPLLLRAYQFMLEPDYEVVGVGSGLEALETLRRDRAFDVVICDLAMDQLDGRAVYGAIEQEIPELTKRIVFCTGGVFDAEMAEFLRKVDNRIIDKPLTASELRAAIDANLAR